MAPTAEKVEIARFVSKGRNFRAILLNPVDHPHPITGDKVVDQRGFTAEFARQPFLPDGEDPSDGTFQWPPLPTDPEAEFINAAGNYVDPVSGAELDVVAALRSHVDRGARFDEVGPDPAELLAEQRELLDEIALCIATRDSARMAAIYEAEENGHRREAVLSAAMSGMRALEAAA